DLIGESIEKAGYTPGEKVALALDVAATEFFSDGAYSFEGTATSPAEMIAYYESLVADYPLVSIEDPLSEDEWDSWAELVSKIGDQLQDVRDHLFVTNPERLAKVIALGLANSMLVKLNQLGTLTETLAAVTMAQRAGFTAMDSHRF